MAGYAAALRVLTRYATIDGINMARGGDKTPEPEANEDSGQ